MSRVHLWCCPGLANGHVAKKQKKNKKEDALPSLDAMLADGMASSGAQQQPGTDLNTTSPGPQEAALHMLESLVQVSPLLSWSMQSMHLDESILLDWYRAIGRQ